MELSKEELRDIENDVGDCICAILGNNRPCDYCVEVAMAIEEKADKEAK
jgi:hypothetical protein